MVSDCSDGTTEVLHVTYDRDSDTRLVFDSAGDLLGENYGGSTCPQIYEGACGGDASGSFFLYSTGDVAGRTCTPRCELCAMPYRSPSALPRCEP